MSKSVGHRMQDLLHNYNIHDASLNCFHFSSVRDCVRCEDIVIFDTSVRSGSFSHGCIELYFFNGVCETSLVVCFACAK